MSTELEKYLKSQREALDVESPDDQVIWEGIRQDLQTSGRRSEKRRVLIWVRNIAAAVIIVVSVGYMINDIIGERRMGGRVSLANIDHELGAREKEYRALVSFKQEEAKMFSYVDNVIIAELLEEILKLDTIYEQTMKDLGEIGYNEQVINTIFDTYEKKIYLLELIILENNKIKNYETDEGLFL
ncbi:MAG: hypothetical protein KAI08_10635 [Bacteroidales bacterium]|nr:hypothetical protein [Bacteroidales bacterium]